MDFLDEQILQLKRKHSDTNFVAPNLQYVIPHNNIYTDNGNWLEAAGIGASNMLNNLGLGGGAQLLGSLGAGLEYISPFSGSRDKDRARLESWGVNPEVAREAYPDEDSWLTSGAKGLLEAQNFIADKINQWRDEAIGDNPSFATQVAEGVGSSGGFMLGGLLGSLASGGNPLAGAIISAITEAASESGDVLGDAYREGKYYDGGLAAANKSFAANSALNTGLNIAGGLFSPWMSNIRNPLTRYAAPTAGEVANELLQEPSQQVIEKSALQSIDNGGNFMSALGQNIPDWWNTAKQLAPTVSMSSLITSLLKSGYDMSSAQNRQIVRDQWRNRMYDPQETVDSLKAEMDKRQKLINQLQREKDTFNNPYSIAIINRDIADIDRNIAILQDRLKPLVSTVSTENQTPTDFVPPQGVYEAYYDDEHADNSFSVNPAQELDIPNAHTPDIPQTTQAPRITALGSNEAYYDKDYYSDNGGDNSHPEQDIPDRLPAVDITHVNTQIGRPNTTRTNTIIGKPNIIRGTQGLENFLLPPLNTTDTTDSQLDAEQTTSQDANFRQNVPAKEQLDVVKGVPEMQKPKTKIGSEGLSEQDSIQTAKALLPPDFVKRTKPDDNMNAGIQHMNAEQILGLTPKPETQRGVPEIQKPEIQDLSALPDEEKQQIYRKTA